MKARWILLTAGCLLLPTLSQAGEAPAPAPPPAAGATVSGLPVQPPAQAPGIPPATSAPRLSEPAAARAGARPEYDPDTGRLAFDFAGLGLTQSRTDDAYVLDIDLRGLPPEQVQVRPAGGGLLLVVRRTAESSREETFDDGRGYARSWGFSTGQRVQRLPAPPDADVRAMQREDSAEVIHISIPRRSDLPAGGGYGQPGAAPGYGMPPAAMPAPPAPKATPGQPQGAQQ